MTEYVFRDVPVYPIDVVDSKGSYLISRDGKKYLDFVSGWCVGNAGWNKEEIFGAIRYFRGPTYLRPENKYDRWDILAEKLISLIHNKGATCFRATGGTEAVELALKISKAYNRRKKFMAFNHAYHGQSFACMALVGLHEDKFGPYPDSYLRLEAGDWEKTTELAVRSIKKGEVSAFISEPIICNLGVIIPPKSFFEEVSEACNDTDTVFVIDEVATGFGRTGKWFGFEHYGVKPDILTIAKGFSSGYAPIGAAIADSKIAESMRFDFSNFSTFGWHPLCVEAAIANIEYIRKNALVEKSEKNGAYMIQQLSEFCEPEGRGLCIGVDLKDIGIEKQCLADGLLTTTLNGRALLFPALDVSKEEIDNGVQVIRKHYGKQEQF